MIVHRLFGWWAGLRQQIGLQSGASQSAETPVTFERAMSVSAWWACVRLLAETIASTPLLCYRINADGSRTLDTDYRLWRLLTRNPNRYQTVVEFFETLMLQLVTSGNFYAAVERNGQGQPVSILPLMSTQMTPELLRDGSMIYTYYEPDGNIRVYSEESIWHVKLFGNGLVGLSPLSYAARATSTAINLDRRAAKLAASGGKTNGILMVDSKLSPEQRKAIRANFRDLTEGSEDQLFVLEANMKYERTSLSPVDMELLNSRRFQVEEICRFMGVPSVLVNDTSGTTAWGSGIHQIIQGFYRLGLTPYSIRITSSIKRNVMARQDRDQYEFEFDFDTLTQGDFATRMEGYSKGVQSGVLKPNDARKRERLPPEAGGDRIYLNSTLVPAGTVPLRGTPGNAPQTTDS